jgi:sarcosine oxidase subunit beta
MRKNADVVVIGGGAIGTAVTYALAKTGAKVILVESGDIAEGTSSKCDGNVLISDKMPGYDARLAKRSQDMFPALSDEIGYDIEWTQKGSLNLIENETEMVQAMEYCDGLKACGIPARMLSQQEVRADEPLVSPHVIGGLEVECDGSLYPMALCYGLALAAQRLGAEVMPYTGVTAIERDQAGRVSKVVTAAGSILTENVVNCAGVWAKDIGRMVGLDIPVEARQGQILVAEQTFRVARRKVVEFGYLMAKFQGTAYKRDVPPDVEEFAVAFVFEPTHADNFLIGSSRRFVGRDTRCHIGVMRALASRAMHFFPVMKDVKIIRAYAGIRPFTPDHMPIVSDTAVPGFYIAAGHEGDGIGLSLVTAEIVSGLISGKAFDLDLAPLAYSRYANHAAVH